MENNNNFDLQIHIDQNNQMHAILGTKDISNMYTMDYFLNVIDNNQNYYQRVRTLEDDSNYTYNFICEKENNNIIVSASKQSSFDKPLVEGIKSTKEELDDLVLKVDENIKNKQKRKHREKIKKGAIISAITIVGIAGTIGLTSLAAQCLKEDIELSKKSPSGLVSYSQEIDAAPDGYVSSELQAERDETRRKYQEEQRAYEESMAQSSFETETTNKSK